MSGKSADGAMNAGVTSYEGNSEPEGNEAYSHRSHEQVQFA